MSTIAVNAITDANGGSTTSINGTTPNAYNTVGKNRIINGNMVIDQRNSGASVSISTSGVYVLDRWKNRANGGGVFSVQQSSTAPAGFNNSSVYTVTTADSSIASSDNYWIAQEIEGFNVADLNWGTSNAKDVTLSFWVRSSVTGTFAVALSNGTTYNRSYVSTYTINSADTFEYKTITIAGDTTGTWGKTNSGGITLLFDLGSGSSYQATADTWSSGFFQATSSTTNFIATNGATFYLTGVQLEVGESATEFEHRPYGTELSLCQRYYWKNGNFGGYAFLGVGMDAGTTAEVLFTFPVQMRASPTASISGCRYRYNGGSNTGIGISANYASTLSTDLNTTNCSASTGSLVFIQTNGSASDYVAFDAEL